jgi:hypothetical protein
MSVSPQPGPHGSRLRDFGAVQADISTFDTREVAAVGRPVRPETPQSNNQAGNEERKEGERVHSQKRKAKKFYVFTLLFLLLFVLGSVCSVVGYQRYNVQYHSALSLAQVGIKHLQTAAALLQALPKNPLDARTVSQAQREFSAASTNFVQLNNELQSLPGLSTLIPVYGSRLSAALRLVPLAIEVSQAGLAGCDALSLIITRFHDPLTSGHGLTMADLAVVAKDLHQIKGILNQAVGRVNALQPADLQLDPRLSKLVAAFHQNLPNLQMGIDEAEQLLTVAPTLLGIGTPTNYLIELLDSSELRPAGGFIGNYGTATFSGGRLAAAHITDVYLLDNAFTAAGHSIPYPSVYRWFDVAQGSWSLRDSNLDADFVTAARYAEQNYSREGGKVPIQGVIAITPTFIQHALAITGPINVPEYQDTVTAQNLIDRIHYHQLGPGREGSDVPSPDGHSSVRKHFTELLAEHFLARVHQLPPSTLSKLVQLLPNSLRSKDLQIYFNSGIAEQLLQRFHLDAAIQAPAGDGLFVVDTNMAVNKANQFITNKLDDRVTIDGSGNATHRTTLTYTWVTRGNVYGSTLYRDYVRIYVPPGSSLQIQDGWQPRGTSRAFGREVWAGFFTLIYGQTRTITLVWMVPSTVTKNGHSWHYQYDIQRQAGALWTLHLQITLPSCAVVTNTSGGIAHSTRQAASLSQSLSENMSVGVEYNCLGDQ